VRAAVYHGRGDIRVEDRHDPVAGPGEVLLKVSITGVCGTDAAEFAHGPRMFPIVERHAASGHRGPMVPGHEFAGRVVELGEGVEGLAVGDEVATGAGVWCGDCARCASGRLNLCTSYWTLGLQRDGGLAEYCAVPAITCERAEEHGLTGDVVGLAQPMAIAVHSMRRGRAQAEEVAVVIGVGGIGAFLVHALVESGLSVVVSDLDPDRRAIATDLGAEVAVDPREQPVEDEVRERSLDIAVAYEVTGTTAGLAAASAALPTGGRLVAVGLHEKPREIDLRHITLAEQELIGTNAHSCETDLPEALRMLAVRRRGWGDIAPIALPLDRLVSDGLMPLVEGRSERIKTLVDPWADAVRDTVMADRPVPFDPGAPQEASR
jgi:(R,R)-butanediol dehydrogenase / meso-butanediol dehydrogenase / diacetyl reductase